MHYKNSNQNHTPHTFYRGQWVSCGVKNCHIEHSHLFTFAPYNLDKHYYMGKKHACDNPQCTNTFCAQVLAIKVSAGFSILPDKFPVFLATVNHLTRLAVLSDAFENTIRKVYNRKTFDTLRRNGFSAKAAFEPHKHGDYHAHIAFHFNEFASHDDLLPVVEYLLFETYKELANKTEPCLSVPLSEVSQKIVPFDADCRNFLTASYVLKNFASEDKKLRHKHLRLNNGSLFAFSFGSQDFWGITGGLDTAIKLAFESKQGFISTITNYLNTLFDGNNYPEDKIPYLIYGHYLNHGKQATYSIFEDFINKLSNATYAIDKTEPWFKHFKKTLLTSTKQDLEKLIKQTSYLLHFRDLFFELDDNPKTNSKTFTTLQDFKKAIKAKSSDIIYKNLSSVSPSPDCIYLLSHATTLKHLNSTVAKMENTVKTLELTLAKTANLKAQKATVANTDNLTANHLNPLVNALDSILSNDNTVQTNVSCPTCCLPVSPPPCSCLYPDSDACRCKSSVRLCSCHQLSAVSPTVSIVTAKPKRVKSPKPLTVEHVRKSYVRLTKRITKLYNRLALLKSLYDQNLFTSRFKVSALVNTCKTFANPELSLKDLTIELFNFKYSVLPSFAKFISVSANNAHQLYLEASKTCMWCQSAPCICPPLEF